MRLPLLRAVLAASVLVASGTAAAAPVRADGTPRPRAVDDLARYVNPFVGTAPGGPDFGHGGGAGNTFPGASAPLGGMQWSPDTVTYQHGGYSYGDNRIRGFGLAHISGAGCAAYGNVPFMPTQETAPPAYATFSHAKEQAAPGSYHVTFDNGIGTDLTTTQRSGIARFTYPATDTRPAAVSIDAAKAFTAATGSVDIGTNTLSGYSDSGAFCKSKNRYRLSFHATFDHPFAQATHPGGKAGSAMVTFAPGVRTVTARVGISFVDVDGARRNALTEQKARSYDTIRQAVRADWNQWLNRVTVGGGTDTQRRVFYTALYHTLLHPSVFSDTDGRYTGMDGLVHRTRAGHVQYADFSGWDVYRCQVQLLALLAPREASDIAQSVLNQGLQAGYFDRWTLANGGSGVMVGDPLPAIASTIHAFGGTDFDATTLLRTALADRQDNRQRPGHQQYDTLGYVPAGTKGVWGSVSTTLEYAVADYALAQLAHRLGDLTTYNTLLRASGNWRNLFNPATGYIQPRAADGTWPAFTPAQKTEYVEGNAAQYTWMVPQDLPGLFAAMGGDAAVTARLDTFFSSLNAGASEPYAYLGNEPSFGTPWAYTHVGHTDRAEAVVHRALATLFTDAPGGLVGNDDLGAMSSWAVWASLGLYPEVPGSAQLTRTAPLFTTATVHRGDGTSLTVGAASPRNSLRQASKHSLR